MYGLDALVNAPLLGKSTTICLGFHPASQKRICFKTMNCLFLEFYSEFFRAMIDLRSLKLCKVCFSKTVCYLASSQRTESLGTLIIQSSCISTLTVRLFPSPRTSLWDLWMNWRNGALRCAGHAPPHWATPSAFALLMHTCNKCLPVSFLLSSVFSFAFLSENTLSPAVT